MTFEFNELQLVFVRVDRPTSPYEFKNLQKILGITNTEWKKKISEFDNGYIKVEIGNLKTVITGIELAKVKSEKDIDSLLELLINRSVDIVSLMGDKYQALIVESNEPFFLELAWENLVKDTRSLFNDESNFIVRILLKPNTTDELFKNNSSFNIIIFAAFSHDDPYLGVVSLKDISPDLRDELNKLVVDENAVLTKAIFNASGESNKLTGVYVLPHTSKEIFLNTDLGPFNILHFMGHGIVDKGLSFESSEGSMPAGWELKNPVKVSDWLNDGVVNKIVEGSPFKLLVLSACDSANPDNATSLVMRCLIKGNAEHAVAFRNGISSQVLPYFWQEFYSTLMAKDSRIHFKSINDNDKIIEAYWMARKVLFGKSGYWDSPIIYLTKGL